MLAQHKYTVLIYISKLSGYRWDEMNIQIDKPPISHLTIIADGEDVYFHVYATDVSTLETVNGDVPSIFAQVKPILENCVNNLAFRFEKGLPDPVYINGSLPSILNPDGTTTHSPRVVTNSLISVTATGCMTPSSKNRAELQSALEQPASSKKTLYSEFRQALMADEPVAQFMSLYRILEALYPSGQNKIDDAIFDLKPDVEHENSPKTGRRESIYLRLRNEVSHVRPVKPPAAPNPTPEKLRLEIAQQLPDFARVVKKAIGVAASTN